MTHPDLTHIDRGWPVVGSDGERIGEVKEVREDHVVVHRGMLQDDLYIPLDRLSGTHQEQLVVNVAAGEAGEQGWAHHPSASHEYVRPATPTVPETTMIETSGYGAGRLASPEVQGMVFSDRTEPGDELAPRADVGPDTERDEDDEQR